MALIEIRHLAAAPRTRDGATACIGGDAHHRGQAVGSVISRPPCELAWAAPTVAAPAEDQRAKVRALNAPAPIEHGSARGGIDAV